MKDTMSVMLRVQVGLSEAESALFEAFHDSMPLSEKWAVTTGIADVRDRLSKVRKHINWLMTCHGNPTPNTAPPAEASAVAGATSASLSPTWGGLADLDDSE